MRDRRIQQWIQHTIDGIRTRAIGAIQNSTSRSIDFVHSNQRWFLWISIKEIPRVEKQIQFIGEFV
jgi:hypothetical protein